MKKENKLILVKVVEDSKWELILSMISLVACILMIFTEGWFAGFLSALNLISTIFWSTYYFSGRQVYFKEV